MKKLKLFYLFMCSFFVWFSRKIRIRLRIRLFYLLWSKIISIKYWWNYDYLLKEIYIINSIYDQEIVTVLRFGRELILIEENLYMVKNIERSYLNKEIKNPLDKATYLFNESTGTFDLYIWP